MAAHREEDTFPEFQLSEVSHGTTAPTVRCH
jgi:hypothetical protein